MKPKLLIFIISFSSIIYSLEMNAQPWYGQQLFPVDSVLLTTAKVTNSSAGCIMAGRRGVRQNGSNLPDFVINKVDANGQYASGNEFMIEYQISNACGATPHNCGGISLVECKNPVQSTGVYQYYAIAVSSTAGIGLATLDQSGNPVQQKFWDFAPNTVNLSDLRNPAIRESATDNIFYLTCNYQYSTCVMKVDVSTTPITIIWNNLYDNTNHYASRDLIESPYTSDELIVVGRTDMASNASFNNWAADAFFTKLDAGNGSVLTHSVYNKQFDGDDWFACIEEAESTTGGSNGYILGGRSHYPIPSPTSSITNRQYIQWICKLDPAGAIVWTDLILPANSHAQGFDQEISRVYERRNSNNGFYEVYGVAAMGGCKSPTSAANCSTAQVVYKLDDAGANVFTPDEFHYYGAWMNQNTLNVYSDAQITAIETGGNNDGIQVFGNDVGAANFLMTKAYFNGEAGCNQSTTTIQQINPGPDSVRTEQINFVNFPPCPSPTWINYNGVIISSSTLCSSYSLSSGDNSRPTLSGLISVSRVPYDVRIYPNPSNGKVTILTNSNIKINQLYLQDNLGRLIYHQKPDIKTNEIVLNLMELKLNSGIYYLDIDTGQRVIHQKFIYTK